MDHSLEEIRAVAMEVLARSIKDDSFGSQYVTLKNGVAQLLEEREPPPPLTRSSGFGGMRVTHTIGGTYGDSSSLSARDADLFLEVFWGLFRDGIICLGANDRNLDFPWCRVTQFGKRVLENRDPLFFHGGTAYASLLKSRLPQLDKTVLAHASEAASSFEAGHLLGARVLLGTAFERVLSRLLEEASRNPKHADSLGEVLAQRTPQQQLSALKGALLQSPGVVPPDLRDTLEAQFFGVASTLLEFRDAKPLDRQSCYVLLQLFVPCCEKAQQIQDILAQAPAST